MTKYCFERRPILVLLLLIGISTAAFSQLANPLWRFSNPKQFGFIVQDVHFLDDNNGLVVGFNGGIAKTTNGGATWRYGVFTFTDATGQIQKPNFNDVHFVNSSIAYAVGASGLLAKSTDGGITWNHVINPLYPAGKAINGLYFLNKDTGYIGGESASGTGTAPKLYVTRNGGATWDSLSAPTGALTNIGYIANPTLPAVKAPITAINKVIERILFVNDSVGYVVGSGSNTAPFTNTTGGTSNSSAVSGGLIWKFEKGTLTDYSLSKEKFGFTGVPTTTITTTTQYAVTTLPQQTIRAIAAVNDSVIIVNSFNNGISVRVRTGKTDSTQSIVVPGSFVKGRYEILQLANVPAQPTPPFQAVIPPQVLPNSNMVNMTTAPNGSILVTTSQGRLGIFNNASSTWSVTQAIPSTSNAVGLLLSAVDVTPSGKVIALGSDGVAVDSAANGSWNLNYATARVGLGINRMEFADCNNGIAVGGFGGILTTNDGGKTWLDKTLPSFQAQLISFYAMSYPAANRFYFATSSGAVFQSPDQGVSSNILFFDPKSAVIYNMATHGTNKIFALGWRGSEAVEKTVLFRSVNDGASWDTIKAFPTGTNAALCQGLKVASADTLYIGGQKGKVFRSTDGGTTWADISPFPAANATNSFNSFGIINHNTLYVASFLNRKVYKTFDAGANWIDVSPNITNEFLGTINDIVMHNADSGYLVMNGGKIMVTYNGGANWTVINAPIGSIFSAGQFVPRQVAAGTPMSRRRLFIAGSGSQVIEFGDPALANVSAQASVVNTNCSSPVGSITANSPGGLAPYTYSLNNGAFQTGNVFNNLTAGTYKLVIKDAACGIDSANFTIGFTDNLTLSASNDTSVCINSAVQLQASSNATAYSWTPAASLSAANIANPIATVTGNTNFIVTATLNSCVKRDTVNITIRPQPQVNAGPDQTIQFGATATLSGTANNPVSISWTPAATLTGANTLTPVAQPQATTTYVLTIRDANNCTASDSATVTVIPFCSSPKDAFTPNGDGINDLWLATQNFNCANRVAVTVFNRYGSIVYQNGAYQNNWNGTYNGKPLPDGTYYYVVTYFLNNGGEVIRRGNLTILR